MEKTGDASLFVLQSIETKLWGKIKRQIEQAALNRLHLNLAQITLALGQIASN